MMITRLPDNVREASNLIKRPEVAQEFNAKQGKINDAQEQTKVTKTQESEMEGIRTDVDKESGGGYGGQEDDSGSRKGQKEDPEQILLVPPSKHKIDIRI